MSFEDDARNLADPFPQQPAVDRFALAADRLRTLLGDFQAFLVKHNVEQAPTLKLVRTKFPIFSPSPRRIEIFRPTGNLAWGIEIYGENLGSFALTPAGTLHQAQLRTSSSGKGIPTTGGIQLGSQIFAPTDTHNTYLGSYDLDDLEEALKKNRRNHPRHSHKEIPRHPPPTRRPLLIAGPHTSALAAGTVLSEPMTVVGQCKRGPAIDWLATLIDARQELSEATSEVRYMTARIQRHQ